LSSTRKLISFDWAIKRILRHKANFAILEGFLSELLYDDIKICQVLESESNREHAHARSNRVDLLVENAQKELIIVEIQHETEYDFLHRMLFGVSKVVVEQIEKKNPYSKIRKIFSIGILYFDLGQGEDYAYLGKTEFIGLNKKDVLKLSSTQQELYNTDKISDIYPEYYLLKINQFDDHAKNKIDEWIYFLKNEQIEDSFTAKGLKEAKAELDILKLSKEERKEYEEYLKDLHYEASMYESSYVVGEKKGLEQGLERGKKEGLEEGAKNKAVEMAKKLKEKGMDADFIADTTGLSKEEIETI